MTQPTTDHATIESHGSDRAHIPVQHHHTSHIPPVLLVVLPHNHKSHQRQLGIRYLQWLSSVAEKEYRKMKTICMLSSVAVALLLWTGRITSSNGISSGNSHDSFLVSSSNYRQRQLERYTNQWPTLQAHHQQHIHQFIRQLRQPLPIPRFLQTTNGTAAPSAAPPPPPPMLCNATTGLVNFYDDDFNSNLFGTPSDIYDSICTCEEGTCIFTSSIVIGHFLLATCSR